MYSPFDELTPVTPAPSPVQGITTPPGVPPSAVRPQQPIQVAQLISAIRGRESGGNPNALSPQGARGSIQIMPGTFKQYYPEGDFNNEEHRNLAAERKIVDDFRRFGGDPLKTAAAYHGGPGAILPDGSINPTVKDKLGTRTIDYAQQIMQRIGKPSGQVDNALSTPQRGADVGVDELGNIYANGMVFDSKDYGRAIEAFKQGAFTAPGTGQMPKQFRTPQPGEVEGYFQKIVPSSNVGKSFRAGIENYKAGWHELMGVGQQMLGRSPQENTGIAAADVNKRYASALGGMNEAPQSWDAAQGVGGVAELTFHKALESAPYMVELLGPGVVGNLIKRGALRGAQALAMETALARGATPEAAKMVASAVGEEALTLSRRYAPEAALTMGGLPSAAGDIYGNMREQNPDAPYNVLAGGALAVPYSALNMLGGGAQLSRALTGEAVHGAVGAMKGVPGRIVRGTGAALVTGAEESLGETGQEVLNQAGRVSVDPRASMTSPDALQRYRESAIVGGLVGGAMGGIGGAAVRARASQPADLLNLPVPGQNTGIQPPAAPLALPAPQFAGGYTPTAEIGAIVPPGVVQFNPLASPNTPAWPTPLVRPEQAAAMQQTTGTVAPVIAPTAPPTANTITGQPGSVSFLTGDAATQPLPSGMTPQQEALVGRVDRMPPQVASGPTQAGTVTSLATPEARAFVGDALPGEVATAKPRNSTTGILRKRPRAMRLTAEGEAVQGKDNTPPVATFEPVSVRLKKRAAANAAAVTGQEPTAEVPRGTPKTNIGTAFKRHQQRIKAKMEYAAAQRAEKAAPTPAKAAPETVAPSDLEIKEEDFPNIEALFATNRTKRDAPKKPSKKEEAQARADQKSAEKLHEELVNDGELNEHLGAIDALGRQVRGPSSHISNKKSEADLPRQDKSLRENKQGIDRIAVISKTRAAAIEAVAQKFDELVKKHGVAKINAMFEYRKANGLELEPDLQGVIDDETGEVTDENKQQAAANVRLSNLWRLYRDGHFNTNAFGFTRMGDRAIGRNKFEEGATPTTLVDWFKGKHVMMHKGGGRIKGIAALAYYMRHYGRTDLEGLLGSSLYHIFKTSGADIDFKVLDGDVKFGGRNAKGAFVHSGVVEYGDGKKMTISKPTIILSQMGATEEVLPHELLHAATWHIISRNPEMRAKFMPIIEAIRKADTPKISDELRMVLNNVTQENEKVAVAELVAYGFTHPEFQDFLKKIEMSPPRGGRVAAKIRNAFEFFVNLVKLATGSHAVKYSAMQRFIEEGARLLKVSEETKASKGTKAKLSAEETALLAEKVTPETAVPHGNLLNPINLVEKIFKTVIETALPFLYGTNAAGKTRIETYLTENGDRLRTAIIKNHPLIARVAEGVIDKWGMPEQFRGLLDMGRKNIHNAGQTSLSLWTNLNAFAADHKIIYDYLKSGGTMDVSKLTEPQQALLNNLKEATDDILSRAKEQGVLPKGLENANVTELIQWINKETARLSFGLKSSGDFKRPKGVREGATSDTVLGEADTYHRGDVFYSFTDPAKPDHVFVPVGANLADVEKEFGHKITLDSSRVWRVESEKGKGKKMWSAYTFAEGHKMMKATNYVDALVYSMHNLMHDTAVNEFFNNIVQASDQNPTDALSFADRDALETYLASAGEPATRIIDNTSHRIDAKNARTPGFWVKLPGGYGNLSNHYVPASVYAAITDAHDTEAFFPGYRNVLNYWKKTKTAWSVPTHFNNIASSFVMMYMNDIPGSALKEAYHIMTGADEASKALWKEFSHSGALVASYSAGEVGTEIARKIDAAVAKERHADSAAGLMQLLHTIEKSKAAQAVGAAGEWAVHAYETEDNVFRLAAFLTAKQRELANPNGKRGEALINKAGKFAADSMINYSIDARYINNLRKTILPFLAWPYRMVPMLIRTALFKPWKIATMASTVYALNAMAYAITGDDSEDEERKRLPEYMRGNLFLMPGAPKAIRMPFDIHGKPVFWDISNFMPLGNFAEGSRAGLYGIPWPQGMMPGGPMVAAFESAFGYDSFSGKTVGSPETDTGAEKVGDRLKMGWNAFTPNVPLPFNRQGDKVYDLLREKHGVTGSEMEWGSTILNMVGPKIVPLDMREREAQAGMAIAGIVHSYQSAMRKLALNEGRYGSPDMESVHEKQAKLVADMLEKIQKAKGEK